MKISSWILNCRYMAREILGKLHIEDLNQGLVIRFMFLASMRIHPHAHTKREVAMVSSFRGLSET